MKEISRIIEQYLMYVKFTKSNGMFEYEKSHLNVIKQFFNQVNVIKCDQLKETQIYQLMDYLKNHRNNSITTMNKKIAALKRAFHYAKIKNHPLYQFQKMKEVKKRFDLLNNDELASIFNYLNRNLNTKKEMIEKLMILLLYETGVRLNELINIEISNINLNDNTILLTTTKTKENRIVFFSNNTKLIIQEVMGFKSNDKHLFWNISKNRPYHKESVHALFKRIKNHCKLESFHPHMFRHTFATTMIEAGMPITSLQLILGHRSIKTTEIYLHVSIKKVKDDFNKAFGNIKYK